MWKNAGSHSASDAVTSWGGSTEIRVSGEKGFGGGCIREEHYGDAKSRLQLRADHKGRAPETGWGQGVSFTADGAPQAGVKGLQGTNVGWREDTPAKQK